MDKLEFIKLHCFGCGLELQNDNPKKEGYIPKKLEADSKFLCQRCFRLQHYGEVYQDEVNALDYETIINNAKKENALVIFVCDLFAFESSFIPSIVKLLKDVRTIIVANKRDVIPASVKDEKLVKFVLNRFKQFNVSPLKVMTISSTKNYNIEPLIEKINSFRENNNVYVFGATSVGKSSLINAFLKVYENNTDQLISTSPYPGTTLKVIDIPLSNGAHIYDTPGMLLDDSIFAHVDQKLIKYVLPRKEIKPKVHQLNEKQSLFIENLAKIDILEGVRANLTIFMSNDLNTTRSKLENSERAFNNMISNKQFKHIDRNIKSIDDLQSHEFVLPHDDCDITISGLVWIKIKGKGQRMRIYTHKGVSVSIRECKI